MGCEKVKSKKEVMKEAQKNNKKVHFASLMDLRHLKNAELEPKSQNKKRQSGAPWSASQMTAAKVMDVIARLTDCDGQAADAVSAYIQVKLEDAPRLLKITESECPDVWISLPRHELDIFRAIAR